MGSSSKLWLIVLVLALAMIAEAATSTSMTGDDAWFLSHVGGKVEDETETLMDSEISRRTLAGRGNYISYGALRANNVPCNRRGQSYYNCNRRKAANPYRRGCSAITRCKRYTR